MVIFTSIILFGSIEVFNSSPFLYKTPNTTARKCLNIIISNVMSCGSPCNIYSELSTKNVKE